MKLIDILVQELPKSGGWPEGADHIATNGYWRVFAYWVGSSLKGIDLNIESDAEGYVTREQYEAALAASKPEWDGEGLPPAGFECEARYRHTDKSKWFHFRCVSVDGGVAFGWAGGAAGQAATTLSGDGYEFRPIRSEADKKRDIIISKIEKAYKDCPYSDAVPQAIYEAIAEHIRID